MAAALARHPITELNRWLHNLHDTTPADILDSHGSSWGSDLRALAANPGGEMVGGVLGTLQLVLSPLASPAIVDACTPGPGEPFDVARPFRIDDFLDSTDTLYLMTEGNADGAGPFVTALVDEIMHQARRASQLRDRERLDPPLAMVLDEPANTAAMPNMPTYMSDSGGRGITLTLAPQGWSQMQRRWGTDGAKEIWKSATLCPGHGRHYVIADNGGGRHDNPVPPVPGHGHQVRLVIRVGPDPEQVPSSAEARFHCLRSLNVSMTKRVRVRLDNPTPTDGGCSAHHHVRRALPRTFPRPWPHPGRREGRGKEHFVASASSWTTNQRRKP
jgi:hypothetical protein